MENSKTAGEMAAATPEIILTPNQAAEQMVSDYYKELETCVNNHINLPFFSNRDFYIIVLMKRERLLNAMGKRTIHRITTAFPFCPRPDYDRNVYKYHHKQQVIEELWLLPSKRTCQFLMKHPDAVQEGEQNLLNYCKLRDQGFLYKMMKKENNERPDSMLMYSKEKE